MKNLLFAASLVAAGVWYLHRVVDDRSHLPQLEERPSGEMVIANAPDGTLQGRWRSQSSGTPTPSK